MGVEKISLERIVFSLTFPIGVLGGTIGSFFGSDEEDEAGGGGGEPR